MSILGKPIIRIVGTPIDESGWIYRPARFESYDGKNVFSHTPHLPEMKVDLELTVESGENRGIMESLYRKALEYYKSTDFILDKSEEPVFS